MLEEVLEYEEIGRRFKINGHYYILNSESMKKNKYYVCVKQKTKKCRGSITVTPNSKIFKKVDHTCNFTSS